MVVLILLAAFNTGTNLLYIMGGTLLSLLTLSLIYGRANVAQVRATLHAPAEVFQDRESGLTFRLSNPEGQITRYGIILGTEYPNSEPEEPRSLFTMIIGGETAERHASVRYQRRGVARLDSLELVSYFPLSMIEYKRRIPCKAETIVYPRLLRIDRRFGGLARGPGQEELAVKGHGSELHSIREYVPGDPARDIHWKLSAKGTGIKIREYESEATSEIELILGVQIPERKPTPEETEAFEKALSVAASLARHYVEDDLSVGLWTAGGKVPFGRGEKHLHRIYRALATLEIDALDPRAPYTQPSSLCQQIWIAAGSEQPDESASSIAATRPPGAKRVDAEAVYEAAMARADANTDRRVLTDLP